MAGASVLPSLERWRVTLRLEENVDFHFDHGGVLRGLLSAALGRHDLPPGLVPFACESGRVHFGARDRYALGMTFIGDARRLQTELVDGLRRLGRKELPADRPRPTLAGNFRVVDADRLPEPDIEKQADRLAGSERATLRFVSPFRLERPEELKEPRAAYLNGDCFPAGLFLGRLWNRLFLLREGRYPEKDRGEGPPDTQGVEARPGEMMWIDVPVEGGPGQRPYTLGGVLGRVEQVGLPDMWLPHLAAGQYAHAGKSTHYGLGAYVIKELDDPLAGFGPARTALERVASPGGLVAAADHVCRQSETPGVDDVAPDEYPAGARAMRELAARIREGDYEPSALGGILIPKDHGGVRGLAVPTVEDRVVQRRAGQVVGPAVDRLLEDCSFAYRKGFSREGAARAIRRAYGDGYRFVLDADIESFFDAVDWEVVAAKLEALFPFEPLVDLIERWIRAPVEFRGSDIERRSGLPQGCPISPLLANLYLDELDEEVLDEDFRLVRYADDFVVLCRSLERTREARETVVEALEDLGLALNPEKTAIRSVDDGFNFLGYLFCRSVVLESSAPEDDGDPEPFDPDDIPDASWMADVPFHDLRSVVMKPQTEGEERAPELAPVGTDGGGASVAEPAEPSRTTPLGGPADPSSGAGTPVYVTTPGTRVSVSHGRLEIRLEGGESRGLPVRSVAHLVVTPRVDLPLPALVRLQEAGVPVYVTSGGSRLRAMFDPGPPDWKLWAAQARARSELERRMEFARSVVQAKLHNQATLVTRFGWGEDGEADRIRAAEHRCRDVEEIDRLLGLEGDGTHVFYQALAAELPDRWGFNRRRRRPPPDPVNAMLSYGYTLLHEEVAAALTSVGLNPALGWLHRGRRGHRALASDLIEEFRFLAEALVWTLVQRRQIKPDDFTASDDGSYPCLLTFEARERFLAAYHDRLNTRFTPPSGSRPKQRYRDFISAQASSLRDAVRSGESDYRPLRLHA